MSWLPSVVTAQPAVEPITIEEARAQVKLELDDTDYDTELNIYVPTARTHVEQYTGTKLIDQTVELRCSSWCDLTRLPVAPISAVTSIKYLDVFGVEQTLDPAIYETVLVGLQPSIRRAYQQTWPQARNVEDAIRIVVTAGYGSAETDVPAPIRQAMLLMIAQWFDNRQDFLVGGRFDALPNVSDALLANFRTYPI